MVSTRAALSSISQPLFKAAGHPTPNVCGFLVNSSEITNRKLQSCEQTENTGFCEKLCEVIQLFLKGGVLFFLWMCPQQCFKIRSFL